MSLYVLVLNEHIDWSCTRVLGIFTSPEKIIGVVLSKFTQTSKQKELVVAYCMGFFDNEESEENDHYEIFNEEDNLRTLINNGDFYSFTLIKCNPDEVNDVTVCTVSGGEITNADKNVVFNGSFKELFEYVRDEGFDVGQYKPYGQTQEGFLALMNED